MTTPRYGLWIDDAPRLVSTPEYWDRVVDIGYRTAAIMIDQSTPGWDPRWTPEQLQAVREITSMWCDVEVVLTCWPTPDREDMGRMFRDLIVMLEVSGASGIEVDLEGNWLPRVARAQGWTYEAACAELVAGLLRLRKDHDVRIEVTTHPAHREANERALVTPHADRALWQVYSTRHLPSGQAVTWRGRYGPFGREQDCRRLSGLATSWEIDWSFGSAAWDQRWPGHEIEEALDVSRSAQLASFPGEIRDWSSRWIVGALSGSESAGRFRAWRKAVIAGAAPPQVPA